MTVTKSMAAGRQAGRHSTGAVAERLHLIYIGLHKHKAETQTMRLGILWTFETSKLTPRDIPFPKGPQLSQKNHIS